ncbi:serine/threonine protein kinase [Candidatus Uabimicrobium amorphum]|uniref:Serine/threonine protein kinase n=1 Tax=Uabimicrobium amorphum TaxID=2596890 RepID=A0A5S9IPX1_UABAM|nr:serine/threonine-protein kinase [Candidatus Uabimicrobium amorphum]BBM85527.1 serine/threonine protein kinase [Candidatus Uabimicrobium amorphum]
MMNDKKSNTQQTLVGFSSIFSSLNATVTNESFERETQLHEDRYEVIEKIGSGGMGSVWKIYDRDLQRHVAVKQVGNHKEGDNYTARLLKEAQLTAQLEHPNIVPIYDVEVNEDQQLLYTMRLVEGVSLKKILDGLRNKDLEISKAWSLTRLLRVFINVAQGVSLAHTREILHRDLKPDNIMLGKFGQVLVVDWGLAIYLQQQNEKKDNDISGTLHYMSPEQLDGEQNLQPQSDIYSLGVILYEMVALERPIESNQPAEIMFKTIQGNLRPIEEIVPCVPAELKAIIDKCLQLSASERYKNAQQLVEDIELFLDDQNLKYAQVPFCDKILGIYTKKGFNIQQLVVIDLKFMCWGASMLAIFVCMLFPVITRFGWLALTLAIIFFMRPMFKMLTAQKTQRYSWHGNNISQEKNA